MSLHEDYDPANIFAKIINGDLPCVKVFEDDKTLAFMDIFPQTEGHTLVIPKTAQAVNLFDIAPPDLKDLIVSVQAIADGVKRALKPDGIRIVQFNGAPAGQTVFHIHFHIMPIYSGGAEAAHAAGQQADPEKLSQIADKIRSAL